MNTKPQADDAQAALWNGSAGRAWVDAQAMLDRLFQPFQDLLLETIPFAAARQVLDIGCGTGAITLAVSQRLGEQGRCVGVDISEPMIAAARARVERQRASAHYVVADAQTHAFAPQSFDLVLSRFGVMFFSDPVAAFANLRRAAKPGAELRFIAWRAAAENPFMTTAERAAAPLLTDLPIRQPDAPGQFAFAERRKVQAILQDSGWSEIDIRPIDVPCSLPEPDLIPYLSRLGPVGMSLQTADEATRERVIATVRAAFEPFVHGAEVRFTAACWMIGARSGGAS
ncbi:SAM-dependent methyltransferase [Lysobacter sp. Root559]|uniref:class I SAM-dependent methyltransferase n=1 Tax=Lysobacter sp. Root559 TaxID=1736559 RepID=UPI0006F58E0B|nr:class I SAM-dependent methyltransferase [Lysobacter sp. Root559]KQZ57470.1 SAM-dependent methyltransferase [Lysobacter sp. Root559]